MIDEQRKVYTAYSPSKRAEPSPERQAAIQRKQQEIESLRDEFAQKRPTASFVSETKTTTSYQMAGRPMRDFSPEQEAEELTQYSVHEEPASINVRTKTTKTTTQVRSSQKKAEPISETKTYKSSYG